LFFRNPVVEAMKADQICQRTSEIKQRAVTPLPRSKLPNWDAFKLMRSNQISNTFITVNGTGNVESGESGQIDVYHRFLRV